MLLRDYVWLHAQARERYEQVKRELAARFPDDMLRYTDAKGPIFWEIIQQVDRWAAEVGWEPDLSDA